MVIDIIEESSVIRSTEQLDGLQDLFYEASKPKIVVQKFGKYCPKSLLTSDGAQ